MVKPEPKTLTPQVQPHHQGDRLAFHDVAGSPCPRSRPRSSRPACSPIGMRWSRTGNATTTPGLHRPRGRLGSRCRHRRFPPPASSVHAPRRGRLGHRSGGPPARPAHHRGGARRCRKTRVAPLHLGPPLTNEIAATSSVMRRVRCGSTPRPAPSGWAGPPAPSAAGSAAPWSTATRPASSPAAGPPAACTPITCVHWENGGPTELSNLVLLRVSHESVV